MENDVEVSEAMPKKKKRLLGFGLDSDEEENGNGAVEELKMYEKERKLKFDEDPFLWWRGNRRRYPLMLRLARKYLAVQVLFFNFIENIIENIENIENIIELNID